ncbi:hypothetical protein HOY82DRAFT_420063 [Tuber indicum]|nr:hypothetical protein HOY82DRAFT_420063 [Tuber indicum]
MTGTDKTSITILDYRTVQYEYACLPLYYRCIIFFFFLFFFFLLLFVSIYGNPCDLADLPCHHFLYFAHDKTLDTCRSTWFFFLLLYVRCFFFSFFFGFYFIQCHSFLLLSYRWFGR